MPGQAKKSIEKGDILYSEIRPINRHYAYVNFPADDYVVSTKLMVLRANNFDDRRLYQFLTLRKTVESLQQEAEGRSGTFPQIRFDILAKLQVPIAPAEVEEEYKSLIHVIYDLIDSNVEENGALSLLRDSLLPRLMSGEIDVSKVELPMQLNSHLLEFDAILEVLDWCVEIAVRTAVCVHTRMVFQEMRNALTEAVYELS